MFFIHLNLYYFQIFDNIFPMYNQCKCNKVVKYVFNEIQICCASSVGLTLRGLSLFFNILPISNTGASIAYILPTVHFLCSKLGSFSEMEYYFYQLAYRDSKVPNRFVGLNQMQCFPSFDWNWGKQNEPTAPATPTISGFTAREMPQVPTRERGRGH